MIGILKSREFNELKTIPVWLPLLLGTLFGVAAAYLVLQQEWIYLVALLVMVPALILLFTYPLALVLIWLLVFPFFLKDALPGGRIMYWILHRAMIPGALFGLLLMSVIGLRKVRGFRVGLVDWIMLGYLVYSLANMFLLTTPAKSLLIRYYDRIFVPFCMYWLVRLLNPDEKDLKRLLPVAFLIILSQAMIGILSWVAPQLLPDQWLGRLGERTVGTFNNPAVFTTTLMFCALFLMQAFHEEKSVLLRWSALVAVGLAFFLVFFSFSRGSWVGSLIILAGMISLYPRTTTRLILIGLFLAAILFLATPLRTSINFAEQRLVTESTAEGRIIEGATTARMINARPLFGWGYNQHEKYDEQFRDRVLNLTSNQQKSSHNTYLLIAAEMGLVGLALYLLPALIWLIRSRSAFKHLPFSGYQSRAILLMLWLLLADHFIAGNFTDLISTLFTTGMWWLTLGLIANINDSTLVNAADGSN